MRNEQSDKMAEVFEAIESTSDTKQTNKRKSKSERVWKDNETE